jgi:hypothetical protein
LDGQFLLDEAGEEKYLEPRNRLAKRLKQFKKQWMPGTV